MGAISVNMSGLKELRETLLTMPKDLQKRALRRVLRKQSNVVLAEIKAVMPRNDAPHLADLLKVGAGKTTHRGGMLRDGIIYPTRAELGISPDDKYYWPFAFEYGHAAPGRGTYNKKGKKRSKTPPKDTPANPVIRNSWDRKETSAANNIGIDTFDAIEKLWAKRGHRSTDTTGQLDRDLAASVSEAILGSN